MTATVSSSGQVRVTVVSATPRSGVAADLIASHLGLDRLAVVRLIARHPAVVADSVPAAVALNLVPLLATLGVTLRLDPPGSPEAPVMVDVAVQPLRDPTERTVARLASHLRLSPAVVREQLADPSGMILGLSLREAEALRRILRRDSSLRIAISSAQTARFDLFLRPDRSLTPELETLLQRLGLPPCLFSGAVGAGLDSRMAALVMARHADEVYALNRDFQRFDLFLAAGHGLRRADLADFVAARTRVRRERLLAPEGAQDVRLEAGLSRAAARRFSADYAAIGLETRIALVAAPVAADR